MEISEADLKCEVKLNSGDLLIFGGSSRLITHGINKFYENTRPEGVNIRSGRLNVTMRCDPWTIGKIKGEEEMNEILKKLHETPPWRVVDDEDDDEEKEKGGKGKKRMRKL